MRYVYLTYDDGPSEWTEPLLDVLREAEAQATFFWLGHRVIEMPDTVIRAANEGHTIGIHGWTHLPWTRHSDWQLRSALDLTARRIEELIDAYPRYARAPHHMTDVRTDAVLLRLGLHYVPQTLDPGDWCSGEDEIVRAVEEGYHMGAVVNLHDGVPEDGGGPDCTDSRQPTVEATRRLLRRVRSRRL